MVSVATVLLASLWVTEPAVALESGTDPCTAEETRAGGGSGASDNPYLVKTICQLQGMHSSPTFHYKLADDIVASTTRGWNGGAGFYPVGLGTEDGFSGSLENSSNYVITGLTINRPSTNNVGLFSRLATGTTIQGVILVDARTTGNNNVGSLVGNNEGMILDSSATGDVSGTGNNVGGLVGHSKGMILDSSATGDVSGTGNNVGGLAGDIGSGGAIHNSSATGNVLGNRNVGGLAGNIVSGGAIHNSYATGDVSGTGNNVGGLAGNSVLVTISNSYATGDVSGTGNNVGGLAGNISSGGDVSNSSATGDVTGTGNNVGGLAGNSADATISNSYATGSVSGKGNNVGGLAGNVEFGNIRNSYATGDVSGHERVGGLVGSFAAGGIINSYATGDVTGDSFVGGLAGNSVLATISNSYATGSVSGKGNNVGGLAGNSADATISNSYATGSVSGTGNNVGGLAGDNTRGIISDSYATGSVTGMNDNVGGLVGLFTTGSIINSYATGSVTGMNNNVGGLAGSVASNSTISNSYATGSVTGTGDNVGGLAGDNTGGIISDSYFARGPGNGWGEQRSFLQMRCPTTASVTCPPSTSVSYKDWDTQVWKFGSKTKLPQLINNHNPDLNLRPYIAGKGEQLVRAGVLPSTTNLVFEVAYPGTPKGSVALTWTLSGMPAEDGLVYFDLGSGKTSTTTSGFSAKLVVMLGTSLTEGAFFDVVLMNDVSVNGDRVRVRVISATYVQNRPVKESEDSTVLTVTAPEDIVSGVRDALQWAFLVDGEPASEIGEIAQFVGSTTGSSVKVELSRPGGKGDFVSFVLRISDPAPAGASTMVNVNIIPECAGGGNDLDTRQDGDGTSTTPYRIWTLCQLQDVRSSPSAYYELAAGINARHANTLNDGTGFEPIATSGTNGGFSGSFVNSSTHMITGLIINRSSANNIGLFSRLAAGATIQGVILMDGRVTGNNNVGSLVGVSAGNIDNSSATGDVSGNRNVGGLAGFNSGGGISNSQATGSVSGTGNNVGGLVGFNSGGGISNSSATGSVSGTGNNVGGLAGNVASNSTISNSYSTGSVSGDENVGGLTGSISSTGTVSNSYATGLVSGTGNNVGGLAGNVASNSTISNSYSTGSVSGAADNVGGLAGSVASNSTVRNSYFARGPGNGWGEQRSFSQMRCPTTASVTCPQSTSVSYEDWDAEVWDFGLATELPQLKGNRNPDLNFRPYIAGQGEQTVWLGPSLGMKDLVFEVAYTGPPGESVTLTWTLSGIPAEGTLVYFDLGNGARSTTASGSSAKLVVMRSLNPTERTFFDVVLMNSVSANGDRVRVQVVEATPPVIDGAAVQDQFVHESADSTSLTFTAVTDPGNEENLRWVFLIDGEPASEIVGVAQFVGSSTGSSVQVRLNRPDGKGDFASFVLRVLDPAGTSAMVVVNIVPICAGGGEDLRTRQKDGAGTSTTPYRIWTLCQLQDVRSSPSAYYELATDIDARPTSAWNDEAGFEPIATGTSFRGSFVNSSNRVITGLTIDRPSTDNVGLFSRLAEGATIRGVMLVDAQVTGSTNVGSLVGSASGVIEDGSATGSVSGDENVGGLVGYSKSSISNSFAASTVAGRGNNVGGLAGRIIAGASVSKSSATGSVLGVENVGGLVGYSESSISVSFATGDVLGVENVGGLVGYNEGSIINSYADGSALGNNNVGGLAGSSTGGATIRHSYSVSMVTGTVTVGGLVGVGDSTATIVASYYYYTGPENDFGTKRTEIQLQCEDPDTPCSEEGKPITGEPTTYVGWRRDIWDFGTRTSLPTLKANAPPTEDRQGQLRIRVYLGGAAR